MISKLENDLEGYDLCIIGAGPAGLTVAAELAYSGLKICALESGAERREPFADSLKKVISAALPIKNNSRERVVGGAGTVWGGLSSPLGASDVEPHWPITFEELNKQWEAAAERYRFPHPEEFVGKKWNGWNLRGLQEKLFIAVRPPYNFASLKVVFQRGGVDLFTHATVTRLVQSGSRVSEVLCKTPEGKEVRVRAKLFVLAAGGIENPRLLLASDIGKEGDSVGRYFMNHPKGYAGLLRLRASLPAASPYLPRSVNGRMIYAGLALSPERQKTEGLLNSYVQLEPSLGPLQRYSFAIWRRLPRSLAPLFNLLRPRVLRLRWYADMEPRAENRITLSDERDALGVPLAQVSYGLGERDKWTLEALHAQLKEDIERSNLGRLEGGADEVLAAVRDDASHHLGGTRMGADPARSVVNADCRVHTIENLYVAGGSVFATGGSANPTYTIVALAIRLAEHLKEQLTPVKSIVAGSLEGKNKILVIGAGRRVQGDVLPALESLADEFSVEGVYARHEATLAGAHGQYHVRPLAQLAGADLHSIGFAYVAVPTPSVAEVLRMLPHELEIILDTPVPLSAKIARELMRFAKVHIAEDSVTMPWVAEAKKKYAPIRSVVCEHSVYRYHGVALVKALCGPIRLGWRRGNTIYLRAGGAKIRIIEPRDYERGKLFINGKEIAGASQRMHEFKREGLVAMLQEIARGKSPWPLAEGRNDARIDWLLHRFWVYIAL